METCPFEFNYNYFLAAVDLTGTVGYLRDLERSSPFVFPITVHFYLLDEEMMEFSPFFF